MILKRKISIYYEGNLVSNFYIDWSYDFDIKRLIVIENMEV
jgi:hypothetical protein